MEMGEEATPFDKVLMRDSEHEIWEPALFSGDAMIDLLDSPERELYPFLSKANE